jgi:predicted ATPase/class 3 adenylate cyclase
MACGRPVDESAPEERAPASYTPRHLAEKILTSRSALEGERKQVTVMFADVKGSVGLSEGIDPEEWHSVMDRFFAILSEGVHRFEGTINQFTGDGVMALFGAPIAHEDHAHRACHAALWLKDQLRAYADELKRTRGIAFAVRMGINSGEVIVGRIGDDLRMDYTAHGSTVGLADRLQKLADPGTVYLSEITAGLVSGFFRLRDLGTFELKGASAPTRVSELEGTGSVQTRLDLARSRGLSRFIGRDREVAVLQRALDRTLDGEGQAAAVVGEAGIGKSRLCFEMAEQCRARGIEVHHAHGVPYGRAIPLLPVVTLLRSRFGIVDGDSAASSRKKIAGTLLLRYERFKEHLPLLFEFLDVPDPERPVPDLDPDVRQQALVEVFAAVCTADGGEPAVILVEDLHWIDPGTEAFLSPLAEAVAETPTLLLVNYRPEYPGTILDKVKHEELRLRALDDEAIGGLLDDLLGPERGLRELSAQVQTNAAGNPFFVEEAIQSLIESGTLEGVRGALRLARPLDRLAIPPTVQAVIAARIDRLEEPIKEILQIAAVIGEKFDERLLGSVAERPDAELDAALRTLESAEFIYTSRLEPCCEYSFRHPLTQEVAYRTQLGDRRARIHGAVARTIEATCPENLEGCADLLAHHWEQAGDAVNTARWSLQAGSRHRARDVGESLGYYRKVLHVLEPVPDSPETLAMEATARAGILQAAAFVPVSSEELARVFEEGKAAALQSRDPRELAVLLTAFGTLQSSTGDADSALEHAKEAIRLAQKTDDPEFEASLLATVMFAYYAAGRLREGLDYAEGVDRRRGVEASREDPPGPDNFLSRGFRAMMLMHMGSPADAGRDLERSIQVGLGQGKTFSWMSGSLVDVALFTGDTRAALGHARTAVEGAEAYGSPFFTAAAYRALGAAHVLDERWDDAIEALENALGTIRETRTAMYLEGAILSNLAYARLGRGESDRAIASAEEAVASTQRIHARLGECLARWTLARVLVATRGTDGVEDVERHLDRLSVLIEETGATSYAPLLHLQRAEASRLVGNEARRDQELREAHRLFIDMGASAHADRVAGELSRSP